MERCNTEWGETKQFCGLQLHCILRRVVHLIYIEVDLDTSNRQIPGLAEDRGGIQTLFDLNTSNRQIPGLAEDRGITQTLFDLDISNCQTPGLAEERGWYPDTV